MPKNVLLIGATTPLGHRLVPALFQAGHKVRIMSRTAKHSDYPPEVDWSDADLDNFEDVDDGFEGIDTVIDAERGVSRPELVDVSQTKEILDFARQADVAHVIYPSMVGIDHNPFGYCEGKLAAERLIEESGVPCTIQRTTELYSTMDRLLSAELMLPWWLIIPSRLRFQSVSDNEVAERLVHWVDQGPQGRVEDIGGPEILSADKMAKLWLKYRGIDKQLVSFSISMHSISGFTSGENLLSRGWVGTETWAEWLSKKYGSQAEGLEEEEAAA